MHRVLVSLLIEMMICFVGAVRLQTQWRIRSMVRRHMCRVGPLRLVVDTVLVAPRYLWEPHIRRIFNTSVSELVLLIIRDQRYCILSVVSALDH